MNFCNLQKNAKDQLPMLTSISALDNLDLVFFLDLAKTSFIDLTFSALLDLALGDLTMSYVLREFFQKEKKSTISFCLLYAEQA